jgi:hypothetical protein
MGGAPFVFTGSIPGARPGCADRRGDRFARSISIYPIFELHTQQSSCGSALAGNPNQTE